MFFTYSLKLAHNLLNPSLFESLFAAEADAAVVVVDVPPNQNEVAFELTPEGSVGIAKAGLPVGGAGAGADTAAEVEEPPGVKEKLAKALPPLAGGAGAGAAPCEEEPFGRKEKLAKAPLPLLPPGDCTFLYFL